MKPEDAKAIFLLEYCAERCGSYHKDDVCGNCEINAAIKALDKQIPFTPETNNLKVGLGKCPVCGGEALLEPYKARKGYEASIQCNSCLGRMITITYDDEKTAVKKVIEAWNRRAGEQKGTDRMDRKEAVEILRNTPIDIINPEENVYSKYFTALILAIEALQEPQVGSWIPVTERLPENHK